MAPHYSRLSIGAYFKKVDEAGAPVEIAPIERWHLRPGYLEALAGQVRATVAAVMKRPGPHPPTGKFAFQSAALTSDPWLGPDAGEVIARLAAEGKRQVLIAPISFVCEHVEILYDVDIVFQQQTRKLGLHLERIEMLNTVPAMIAGLADLVRSKAKEMGWL